MHLIFDVRSKIVHVSKLDVKFYICIIDKIINILIYLGIPKTTTFVV